jgi:hypothetical protein
MAALNFPSSPTLGQQYVGTNGVTYTWDGETWTANVTGGTWTLSGTTLAPTTSTVDTIQVGSGTQKARLYAYSNGTLEAASNYRPTDDTSDDAAQASGTLDLAGSGLLFSRRATQASAWTSLLQLDGYGKLILPTSTSTGDFLEWGSTAGASSKGRLWWGPTAVSLVYNVNAAGTMDVAANHAWSVDLSNGTTLSFSHSPPGATVGWSTLFTFDNGGNLTIVGAIGQKATGTTWANPSDIRLKKDIVPYARGLADILQLEPISYTLKATGQQTCGLDAEKVKAVFPECVGTTRMKLEPGDGEDTEVLTLDIHPILIALLNAVRELNAKVS